MTAACLCLCRAALVYQYDSRGLKDFEPSCHGLRCVRAQRLLFRMKTGWGGFEPSCHADSENRRKRFDRAGLGMRGRDAGRHEELIMTLPLGRDHDAWFR